MVFCLGAVTGGPSVTTAWYRVGASSRTAVRSGWGGIRTLAETGEKNGHEGKAGAQSGALDARRTEVDGDLAPVIEAWPTLPATVKIGILAMVRAAGGRDA